MDTAVKTRPPLWLRKFKSWASQQQPNEDGFIDLVTPDRNLTTYGSAWQHLLPRCDSAKFQSIMFDPRDDTLFVTVLGRNVSDFTSITAADGDTYAIGGWPYTESCTHRLPELPPGGKSLIMNLIGSKQR